MALARLISLLSSVHRKYIFIFCVCVIRYGSVCINKRNLRHNQIKNLHYLTSISELIIACHETVVKLVQLYFIYKKLLRQRFWIHILLPLRWICL